METLALVIIFSLATTGDMLPRYFERQSSGNSQAHVQMYPKWLAVVSSVHGTGSIMSNQIDFLQPI